MSWHGYDMQIGQPITPAQRRLQRRAEAAEGLVRILREAVAHYEEDLRILAEEEDDDA